MDEGNVGGSGPVTYPKKSCCSAIAFRDLTLLVSPVSHQCLTSVSPVKYLRFDAASLQLKRMRHQALGASECQGARLGWVHVHDG